MSGVLSMISRLRRLLFGLIFMWIGVVSATLAQDDFLPPEEAFAFSAVQIELGQIELRYQIAPEYYLYRERFAFTLEPDDGTLGEPVFPLGRVKYDPTFEQDMEVYVGEVVIRVPVPVSVLASQVLKVVSQGCADAGLCYPPMENRVVLATLGAESAQTSAAGSGLSALLNASDTGLARGIAGSGWLTTIGVFFLLGLLLAFTPCVLPMMPILSALIVAQRDGIHLSRSRGMLLASAYVLGMSVVYTLLGIAAGLSGVGLAAWLQTPWVLTVFAALLTLLALAMFDVLSIQMPAALQTRLSAALSRIPGGRFTSTSLMGAVSAFIVGPCVAAPLAGALLYLSQTGDVVLGGTALFAMAWGMGVPLLLLGASSGALLPRTGVWMEGVKRFFGVLLLATAWWMLTPMLASWLLMLGWALLATVAAVLLRAFDPLPTPVRVGSIFAKALGLLLALLSVVLVLGVASGGRDLLQPLSHLALSGRGGAMENSFNTQEIFTPVRSLQELDALLARAGRPVMLDVYADWCVSCKEMERFTFSDPSVAAKMQQMIRLQADVTANSTDDRALLRRFRLFGPPGILFFAPDGQELTERVVGFQNAKRFDAVLARVLAQG